MINLLDFKRDSDKNDVRATQISMVLIAVNYSAWAPLMRWIAPDMYEGGRIYPTLLCLLLCFVSTRVSPESFYYRKFHAISFLGSITLLIHFIHLSLQNYMSTFHMIGYLMVTMSGILFMLRYYQVILVALLGLVGGTMMFMLHPDFAMKVHNMMMLVTIVSFAAVFGALKIKLIEDRHSALLEERRAKDKLMSTSKMTLLGELASGLGHEINNPLMIISTELQLIDVLKKADPEIDPLLETIEKQVFRIGKVTGILKGFMDNEKSVMSNFSLNDTIKDTLQLVDPRVKKDNVEVTYIGSAQMAFGRSSEISQILINILSNSFDAVSSQIDKRINIELTSDSECAVVKIMDNGPGIAKEINKKIFVPFFTTKDPDKGTGVGLTIASQLADKNDCELFLDEASPVTTFVLRIPLKQKAASVQLTA